MWTHQPWSSSASTTGNGGNDRATCQPSAYHTKPRHAASASGVFTSLLSMPSSQATANSKPVCSAMETPDGPTGRTNASTGAPTARRLLAEARQTICPESRDLGRLVTAMDLILDHRLLVTVGTAPAATSHRCALPRNCAARCREGVDGYRARQQRRGVISPRMKTESPVSAERSTKAWPPDLDGDEVWDRAS